MSTNAAVRTAWKEGVFNNLLPVRSYDHLFSYSSDEHSADKGYTRSKLDHWQYQVSSVERPVMFQRNELTFTVTVARIIADDPEGRNHNTLLDDFRSLLGFVDDMGVSWGATIDLPTEYPREIRPELVTWGSIPAWRATAVFKGVKEITPA